MKKIYFALFACLFLGQLNAQVTNQTGSIKGDEEEVEFMAPTFDASVFALYPNPVKDELQITNNYIIDNVQVINLLGQEILFKSVNDIQTKINMSGLLPGLYLVTISSNESTKTLKVYKQ